MIITDLIYDRINNFWGYGDLESRVWFVGIEEKFDDKKLGIEMLEKQFIYSEKNQDEDGMISVDRSRVEEWGYLANMEPFLQNGKRQRTWRLPIALYLYIRNKIRPSNYDILNFQKYVLADGNKKEVATLELSPLPAFSTKKWFYDEYKIPELKTRSEYEKRYFPKRAEELKRLVKKHGPRLVLFYSSNKKTHVPRWTEVVGKDLEIITDHDKRLKMYFAQISNTSFCVIPQPTAGVSYNELYEYADRVRDRITM